MRVLQTKLELNTSNRYKQVKWTPDCQIHDLTTLIAYSNKVKKIIIARAPKLILGLKWIKKNKTFIQCQFQTKLSNYSINKVLKYHLMLEQYLDKFGKTSVFINVIMFMWLNWRSKRMICFIVGGHHTGGKHEMEQCKS